AAKEASVVAVWSGLGYYRRARNLHAAAKVVVKAHAGEFPRTSAALRTLPGIGEYTAAAIASIAFGEPVAVVDGNVERVILRLAGRSNEDTAAQRAFVREQAQGLMPGGGERTSLVKAAKRPARGWDAEERLA